MNTLQQRLNALSSEGENSLELNGGEYTLEAPIQLGPEHNGLTIDGGGAQINCGCALTDWFDDGDGLLAARVPEGAEPAALLIGGVKRPRARYPESGFLTYKTKSDVRWLNSTNGGWNRPLTHEELTRVEVDPADIPMSFQPENASITIFHVWDESTVRVDSFDRETGMLYLKSEAEHPAGGFGKCEYALWGIREGMTRPGQWYLDRARRLMVYWPLPGEDANTLSAEIPLAEHAFVLNSARDITIRNLSIRCANTHYEKSGLRALNCPGAIEGWDCERVTIDKVNISQVAGSAIKFMRGKDIAVRGCDIADCGAGGIFEMETMPAIIEDNRIERIGQSVYSAIGIHAGGKSQLVFVQDGCAPETGSVVISHNTITDTPYCAITVGGGPHTVEYNRMERCMTVLEDGAAIYCSRGNHTVLRGNYAADIAGQKSHAYYFDEMSFNSVCEGNVAINVKSAFHNHLSSHCVYRNNAVINEGDMQITLARSDHFLFENNVLIAGGRITFSANHMPYDIHWPFEDLFNMRANLIWAKGGIKHLRCLRYDAETLYDGELPPCAGVIRLDPRLSYAQDGAPIYPPDSPIRQLGINAPSVTGAGAARRKTI